MLEVRIEVDNFFADWVCWACHGEFTLTGITAHVYINGERAGDLCLDCLKGGPEAIRQHLLSHAAEIKEKALTIVPKMLENAEHHEELAAEEITMPTWEEWEYKKWQTRGFRMPLS